MIHNMKLRDRYFNSIKNGTKIIELRLYDEKRKLINIGDIIKFKNIETSEELDTEVINLYIKDSFKDIYDIFSKEQLGYFPEEVSNYKDMEEFYSQEDIKKYGVVGINIKVIK